MHTLTLAIIDKVLDDTAAAAAQNKAVVVYAPHGHDVRRISRALTERGLRHATLTTPDQLTDRLTELASGTIDALVTTDKLCAGWVAPDNVEAFLFTSPPVDHDDPQLRARVHRLRVPAQTYHPTYSLSREDATYAQIRARSARLR